MSKTKIRYDYVKELAEEFMCEYPDFTDEHIADYVAICDLNVLETNYFVDLVTH